jgi:hypothetical protein
MCEGRCIWVDCCLEHKDVSTKICGPFMAFGQHVIGQTDDPLGIMVSGPILNGAVPLSCAPATHLGYHNTHVMRQSAC